MLCPTGRCPNSAFVRTICCVPFTFNNIASECEVGLLEHLHSLDERRGSADLSDDDLANVKRFVRDENRGPGASA